MHAQGLAKQYESTIHLLMVFPHRPAKGSTHGYSPDVSGGLRLAGFTGGAPSGLGASSSRTLDLARQLEEAYIQEAQEYLEHTAAQLGSQGMDVVTQVHEGAPHEHIIEYAKQHRIDVIIMATHGYGGIKRLIVGSTTDRVVRAGEVPVLVAP